MRRIAVVAALSLALAACGGTTAGQGAGSPPSTHTITGTVSLQGSALAGTEAEDKTTPNENFTTDKDLGLSGNGCLGTGGYDDLQAGLQVTVSNESGTTIGTGTLDSGEVVRGQFWNTCVFPFTVANVPTAKFYRIEAGHRGQVSYSYDQMQASHWSVKLSLG
jgi:predicted small secreted protein